MHVQRKKPIHPQNHRTGNPNPKITQASFDQKLERAEQILNSDRAHNIQWAKHPQKKS